jgi:hypothetical protein
MFQVLQALIKYEDWNEDWDVFPAMFTEINHQFKHPFFIVYLLGLVQKSQSEMSSTTAEC